MVSIKVYLSPPTLDSHGEAYVLEALRSGWIAPVGPFINRFEKAIEQLHPKCHAIALQTGTAAIHSALKILGVQPGDEVLCSDFTFIATASPILYLGATPVFVDCEPQTWNMDPDVLEQAIQDRIRLGKHPKAIIIAHCYGTPGYLNRIQEISDRYQIPWVEDAAEALGSHWQKQALGSLAHWGVLSFNGNKICSASAG